MMKSIPACSNISKVVANAMCCGCGFCAALCPYSAIHIVRDYKGFYTAHIDTLKCKRCGVCSQVCPSCSLQLGQLSKNVTNAPFYNPLLGRYIEVYRGHSGDSAIRRDASSGGVITSLLVFLMEQRLIDKAIVTTMDHKNPLSANAIIASTKEDIIRGIGSKYTPVSMHQAIYYVVKNNFRFALVGLPCHIEALRKAEEKIPKLRKLIFLRIGLYCNNLPSLNATKYVLWYFKIPAQKIAEIKYRGNGWPGYMTVKLKHGEQIKIPFAMFWDSGFGQYFTSKRCLLCSDHTAELADLSVGDPWTIKPVDQSDQFKESMIVVRSKIGHKALCLALRQGYLYLSELNVLHAIQTTTLFKKRNKNSRAVRAILGIKSIPFSYSLPLNFSTVVLLLDYRVHSFLASYEKLWPLLKISTFVIRNLRMALKLCAKIFSPNTSSAFHLIENQ